MKKNAFVIVLTLLATFFVLGVIGIVSVQAQQIDMKPVKLIFASYDRITSDSSMAAKSFMARVTERTNGLVTFRPYFSGAMGGPREIFPSVSSGMVHVGISRTAYYPGKFALASIDELPFTGYQMDARQKAYLRLLDEFPELEQEFSKQNLKYLGPLQSNAPSLFSKEQIMQPGDFKGLKIRGTGTSEILLKAWGGTPVNINIGDLYDSISRGTVVGAFGFPPQTGVAFALHEVCKYFIDTGTGALGLLSLVMNQDTYNKLPASVQKIFDEEGKAVSEKYPEIRTGGIRKSIPKALAAGVEIVSMPEETQKRLAELGRADLHEKWVKAMAGKGIEEATARKLLARMMELYDQYAPQSTFKDFWALYETEFKK